MPITFDQTTGRFRDANGRFVAASRVHHEINKTVNKLENYLHSISSNINPPENTSLSSSAGF